MNNTHTYSVNLDGVPGANGSRTIKVQASTNDEAKNIAERMTGGRAWTCIKQSTSASLFGGWF